MTTYAPATLKSLASYWGSHGGVNLGIVGDTRHAAKGVSYHLGKSQLTATAYSRRTVRDQTGLTEAASAIDLGKLHDSFDELRKFSAWFAQQCLNRVRAYSDVREVIWFDAASGHVMGWTDLAPKAYVKDYGDLGHKTHTHISFYRDSEQRDKVALFRPYFETAPVPPKPPVTAAPHFAAVVSQPTPLWNVKTGHWVYNGRNNIKVGTKLTIRGAKYKKGGQECYPIVAGTPYGGYWVPVAHVKVGAKLPA